VELGTRLAYRSREYVLYFMVILADRDLLITIATAVGANNTAIL
jgi:hypothetical protein